MYIYIHIQFYKYIYIYSSKNLNYLFRDKKVAKQNAQNGCHGTNKKNE